MIYRYVMLLVVVTCAACSSNSYVAEDKSTEYKNARSLPPLKKPAPISKAKSMPLSQVPVDLVVSANDTALLKIDTNLGEAWQNLGHRLTRAGLTVHYRSQDLARYAIGCSGIDETDSAKMKVKKSGKVPFLKKEVQLNEHCALQLKQKGNVTFVEVLDRYSEEVSATKAVPLLTKLINIE